KFMQINHTKRDNYSSLLLRFPFLLSFEETSCGLPIHRRIYYNLLASFRTEKCTQKFYANASAIGGLSMTRWDPARPDWSDARRPDVDISAR
ncbi:hypothetical protein Trydic_g8757, partial [Trypoxylus dichotomus]